MKEYLTKFLAWLKPAMIRCIRTIAQSAIATIGTSTAMGDVKWKLVVSVSLLSGVLSLLTSIVSLPEANK